MPRVSPRLCRCGAEIFHNLKDVLKSRGYSTGVGDEGGFAPNLKSNEEAVETILEAIDKAGYKAGDNVMLALDPASSEFYKDGKYIFKKSDKRELSSEEMAAYWTDWCAQYPIISIEDGMAENDWDGWKNLTDSVGEKVQLVGDDLFVTNVKFLQKGIDLGAANSILIKVNQIGTLTETLDAIELARTNNMTAVISHRSRRDRRHLHRRPRGRDKRRPDQNRQPLPLRPHRKIQSASTYRRRPRRLGKVSGTFSVLSVEKIERR